MKQQTALVLLKSLMQGLRVYALSKEAKRKERKMFLLVNKMSRIKVRFLKKKLKKKLKKRAK